MNTIPKRHPQGRTHIRKFESQHSKAVDKLKVYGTLMRLPRPIGIYLLFWPGLWGLLAGAYPQLPQLFMIILFGMGAVCMRGFGCVINDLWDLPLDGFVARTQKRPLATHLLRTQEAFILAAILGLASFGILLSFNKTAILVGLLVVPLVLIYPYMKRVTFWAQGVLGITFSWGVLLGWVCENTSPRVGALICLYGASVLWVVAYDTLYGWQDMEDDALLGLKSTSLLWKKFPKGFLSVLYGSSLILFVFFGFLQNRGIIFYGTLASIGLYFFWQVSQVDIKNATACLRAFKSANWAQGLLAFGLLFDAINKVSVNDLISYFIQTTAS